MLGAVAWPGTVLCVVFLFRQRIGALLARPLATLEAGPVKATWATESGKVGATLLEEALETPGSQRHGLDEGQLAASLDLAESVPVPAVIASFKAIEQALVDRAAAAGLAPGLDESAVSLGQRLAAASVINSASADAIEGLARLRDIAASDDGTGLSVTPARAAEFVRLVDSVLAGMPAATA